MECDILSDSNKEQIEIDKSFELFKYSNLLKQRTWFKLKCEFTLPSNQSTSSPYKIRWFKLNNKKNHTVLNEFGSLSEHQQQKITNTDFSNVFISELETREIETTAHKTSPMCKVKSSLLFVFKNLNDLNKANGVYLCKPDYIQNDSIPFQLGHLESIQEITINGK